MLSNDVQQLMEKHRLIDFAHVTSTHAPPSWGAELRILILSGLVVSCVPAVDNSRLLGAGAFSRVYRGTYKHEPVAIKFFVRLNEVRARRSLVLERVVGTCIDRF